MLHESSVFSATDRLVGVTAGFSVFGKKMGHCCTESKTEFRSLLQPGNPRMKTKCKRHEWFKPTGSSSCSQQRPPDFMCRILLRQLSHHEPSRYFSCNKIFVSTCSDPDFFGMTFKWNMNGTKKLSRMLPLHCPVHQQMQMSHYSSGMPVEFLIYYNSQ